MCTLSRRKRRQPGTLTRGHSRRVISLLLAAVVSGACASAPTPRLRAGVVAAGGAGRSGFYLTSADFESERLTDARTCAPDSRAVVVETFSEDALISMPGVAGAGQFNKSGTYGFRTCSGADVRFVGASNYQVVRAPPLFLYQRSIQVSAGKGGLRRLVSYGFSTSASDSMRPLTMNALKRAYPERHAFHDLIDLAFRSDEELMRFDDFHQEYRIARLLRESTAQSRGDP